MQIKEAYDQWSENYDSNENKTRDLESVSLKQALGHLKFKNILEVGCGTGKNTLWLSEHTEKLLAVDYSEKMMEIARKKVSSAHIEFQLADINQSWDFAKDSFYDLTTFSLVLEHIPSLDKIFEKLKRVVIPGGIIYIGELHPFKQYAGSKARFENADGVQVLECYTHHFSDYFSAANRNQFTLLNLNEHFDNHDKSGIPRILSMVFRKQD